MSTQPCFHDSWLGKFHAFESHVTADRVIFEFEFGGAHPAHTPTLEGEGEGKPAWRLLSGSCVKSIRGPVSERKR